MMPEPDDQELSPLDRARLASVSGGDGEFERELLETFVEDARAHAATLAAAVAAKDREAARRAAHAVKGSARNIGAPRIASVAAALEVSLVDGVFDAAAPVRLSSEIDRLEAELGK